MITKYAEMISLEPQDIANFPLYKFIDRWYGTEYRLGGTDNTGIDCSAFCQKLYGDVYETPIRRTSRQQHRQAEHIAEEEAKEGDLVFFKMRRLRISHVGVYLANGYFVHASGSHGVTISSLADKYWQRRFAGYGRLSKPGHGSTESGFTQ
jgi:cell wall-associated NlpC family hydrolase